MTVPVNPYSSNKMDILQRDQYAKGGLGVRYWDYRDRKALQFIKGDLILDLGCGEGITLEKLISMDGESHIAGLDIDPENIEICRNHGLPILAGSVFDLPFSSDSLDTVVFSEVIEHLEDAERAIAEIHRVLKPGGSLIIVFPNDPAFMFARIVTGKIKEAFYDPGHVKQWTPRAIRRLLTGGGYHVVDQMSIPFVFWPICLHHIAVASKQELS